MAKFSFNSNDAPVIATGNRGPIPAGKYEMVITNSDLKMTKAGTGQYIELEMQVIDGEHGGRRLWEMLNIANPSKQAEDIAKAKLGALCNAVGVVDMDDTEQLHDIPFIATVEIDRKDPQYNRIVGYSAASAAQPKAPAAPARPAAPAGARPWAR